MKCVNIDLFNGVAPSRRATKLFAEGHFKLHYSQENRTATVAAHTHHQTHTYTHTITGRHTLWDLTALICWFAEFDFRFSPLLPLSFSLCVSLTHFFPIFISIILAAVGVFVISMSGPALSVCRQQSLRSNELILALQWQPSQERGRSGHE